MNKLLVLWGLLPLLWSCGKEPDNKIVIPTPSEKAPTSISLSSASLAPAQAGESFTLTITSPVKPEMSTPPEWISTTPGAYKNYKMQVTVKVAANETYEARTANLTVSASGVPSVNLRVTQDGKTVVPDPTLPSNAAIKWMKQLGVGWNLGNQLDALHDGDTSSGGKYGWPEETCWHNGVATQQTFNKVKEYGFTFVRIPVTWTKLIGPAPDYKLDETRLSRVEEIVGYAHNAGLKVIMDTHHDENFLISYTKDLDARIKSGEVSASRREELIAQYNSVYWLNICQAVDDPQLNAEIEAKIRAVWTQLAHRFKNCGDWLMFEGFNELNDGGWGGSDDFKKNPARQCNVLNEWWQIFVDAVRATGGNNATRWLCVAPYASNPKYVDYLNLPNDPANKIMVTFHYYDPSEYTIGDKQYSDWGHTGDPSRKDKKGDEDYVKSTFQKLLDKYAANNIPVCLDEFGCSLRDKTGNPRAWAFYLYYLEYVVKAARAYGIPAGLWDAGGRDYPGQEKHPYINHTTGEFLTLGREPIETVVKAWTTNDATYTLQSVYDRAPVF